MSVSEPNVNLLDYLNVLLTRLSLVPELRG